MGLENKNAVKKLRLNLPLGVCSWQTDWVMDITSNIIFIAIAALLAITIALCGCRHCAKSMGTSEGQSTQLRAGVLALPPTAQQHPPVQFQVGGAMTTQLSHHTHEPPSDFSVVAPYPIVDDLPPAYDDVVNNRVQVNSWTRGDVTSM